MDGPHLGRNEYRETDYVSLSSQSESGDPTIGRDTEALIAAPTLETHKIPADKTDAIIDFVSMSLLHDPRWVFLVSDETKRLKQIRSLVKPTIKWLATNGSQDAWGCRDRYTKELVGISVWLPPGVKVAIPFSSLFAASVKTLSNQGLTTTSKIKAYFQGLTKWMEKNSPEDGWVLFYCVVPSTTKFIKEHGSQWIQTIREQLIYVPQHSASHTEKAGRPIWTYLTDTSLLPSYNSLGMFLSFAPAIVDPSVPPLMLQFWVPFPELLSLGVSFFFVPLFPAEKFCLSQALAPWSSPPPHLLTLLFFCHCFDFSLSNIGVFRIY